MLWEERQAKGTGCFPRVCIVGKLLSRLGASPDFGEPVALLCSEQLAPLVHIATSDHRASPDPGSRLPPVQ